MSFPARKYTAQFTLIAFVLTSFFWETPSLFPATETSLKGSFTLPSFRLPVPLGKIEDWQDVVPNRRLPPIVYLQDAHGLYDAQKSIQGIIDYLQKDYGLPLVALEGAAGPLDPILFRTFPAPSIREKVFGGLMRKGEISGVDAAAVLNEGWSSFVGIENKALYLEDRKAFIESIQAKEKVNAELGPLIEANRREKQRNYSSELWEFDQKAEALEAGTDEIFDYLIWLSRYPVSPVRYPKLQFLIGEMVRQEKKDPRKKEHGDLFLMNLAGAVKTRLEAAERQEYQRHYDAFRKQAGRREFIDYLVTLARQKEIPLKPFIPFLADERRKARLYSLAGRDFFKELDTFLAEQKGMLFRSELEKEIDRESHQFQLLKKLASLELTRDELKELQTLPIFSSPPAEDDAPHRTPAAQSGTAGARRDLFRPHLRFYELALKRDQALFKNLEKEIRRRKPAFLALVTGGFHAEGMKAILKEKGYPFAVVAPHIGQTEESPYLDVMLGQNLSFAEYLPKQNAFEKSQIALKEVLLNRLDGAYSEAAVRGFAKQLVQAERRQSEVSLSEFLRHWLAESRRARWELSVNHNSKADRKVLLELYETFTAGPAEDPVVRGIKRRLEKLLPTNFDPSAIRARARRFFTTVKALRRRGSPAEDAMGAALTTLGYPQEKTRKEKFNGVRVYGRGGGLASLERQHSRLPDPQMPKSRPPLTGPVDSFHPPFLSLKPQYHEIKAQQNYTAQGENRQKESLGVKDIPRDQGRHIHRNEVRENFRRILTLLGRQADLKHELQGKPDINLSQERFIKYKTITRRAEARVDGQPPDAEPGTRRLARAEARITVQPVIVEDGGAGDKYFNPAIAPDSVSLIARRVSKDDDTSKPHRSDIVLLQPADPAAPDGVHFKFEKVLIKDAEDPRTMKIGDEWYLAYVRAKPWGSQDSVWQGELVGITAQGEIIPGAPVPLGRPVERNEDSTKNDYVTRLPDGQIVLIQRSQKDVGKRGRRAIQFYYFEDWEHFLQVMRGKDSGAYWKENSVKSATLLEVPPHYHRPGFNSHIGFNTIVNIPDKRYKLAILHLALVSPDYTRKIYETAAVLLDSDTLKPVGEPVVIHTQAETGADILYATGAKLKDGILTVYAGRNDREIVRIEQPLAEILRLLGRAEVRSPEDGTMERGEIGWQGTLERVERAMHSLPPEGRWTLPTLAYALGLSEDEVYFALKELGQLRSRNLILDISDLDTAAHVDYLQNSLDFGRVIKWVTPFIVISFLLIGLLNVIPGTGSTGHDPTHFEPSEAPGFFKSILTKFFYALLPLLTFALPLLLSTAIHEFGHWLAAKIRWRGYHTDLQPKIIRLGLSGGAVGSERQPTLERGLVIMLGGVGLNLIFFMLGLSLFSVFSSFISPGGFFDRVLWNFGLFNLLSVLELLPIIVRMGNSILQTDGKHFEVERKKIRLINQLVALMEDEKRGPGLRIASARKLGRLGIVSRKAILALLRLRADPVVGEAAKAAISDLEKEQSLLLSEGSLKATVASEEKATGKSFDHRAEVRNRNQSDQTREAYDVIAEAFAEESAFFRNEQLDRQLGAFVERFPNEGIVLDAATGSGRDTAYLRALLRKKRDDRSVVGLDYSPKMLEQARKHHPDEKFELADLRNIPYDKESVGGIWARSLLHTLTPEDAGKVLDQFRRVLRDDGILFLWTREGTGEGIEEHEIHVGFKRYIKRYQLEELVTLLRQHGFDVIDSVVETDEELGSPWIRIIATPSKQSARDEARAKGKVRVEAGGQVVISLDKSHRAVLEGGDPVEMWKLIDEALGLTGRQVRNKRESRPAGRFFDVYYPKALPDQVIKTPHNGLQEPLFFQAAPLPLQDQITLLGKEALREVFHFDARLQPVQFELEGAPFPLRGIALLSQKRITPLEALVFILRNSKGLKIPKVKKEIYESPFITDEVWRWFEDWFQKKKRLQKDLDQMAQNLTEMAHLANGVALWKQGLFNADPSIHDMGVTVREDDGRLAVVPIDASHIFEIQASDPSQGVSIQDIVALLETRADPDHLSRFEQYYLHSSGGEDGNEILEEAYAAGRNFIRAGLSNPELAQEARRAFFAMLEKYRPALDRKLHKLAEDIYRNLSRAEARANVRAEEWLKEDKRSFLDFFDNDVRELKKGENKIIDFSSLYTYRVFGAYAGRSRAEGAHLLDDPGLIQGAYKILRNLGYYPTDFDPETHRVKIFRLYDESSLKPDPYNPKSRNIFAYDDQDRLVSISDPNGTFWQIWDYNANGTIVVRLENIKGGPPVTLVIRPDDRKDWEKLPRSRFFVIPPSGVSVFVGKEKIGRLRIEREGLENTLAPYRFDDFHPIDDQHPQWEGQGISRTIINALVTQAAREGVLVQNTGSDNLALLWLWREFFAGELLLRNKGKVTNSENPWKGLWYYTWKWGFFGHALVGRVTLILDGGRRLTLRLTARGPIPLMGLLKPGELFGQNYQVEIIDEQGRVLEHVEGSPVQTGDWIKVGKSEVFLIDEKRAGREVRIGVLDKTIPEKQLVRGKPKPISAVSTEEGKIILWQKNRRLDMNRILARSLILFALLYVLLTAASFVLAKDVLTEGQVPALGYMFSIVSWTVILFTLRVLGIQGLKKWRGEKIKWRRGWKAWFLFALTSKDRKVLKALKPSDKSILGTILFISEVLDPFIFSFAFAVTALQPEIFSSIKGMDFAFKLVFGFLFFTVGMPLLIKRRMKWKVKEVEERKEAQETLKKLEIDQPKKYEALSLIAFVLSIGLLFQALAQGEERNSGIGILLAFVLIGLRSAVAPFRRWVVKHSNDGSPALASALGPFGELLSFYIISFLTLALGLAYGLGLTAFLPSFLEAPVKDVERLFSREGLWILWSMQGWLFLIALISVVSTVLYYILERGELSYIQNTFFKSLIPFATMMTAFFILGTPWSWAIFWVGIAVILGNVMSEMGKRWENSRNGQNGLPPRAEVRKAREISRTRAAGVAAALVHMVNEQNTQTNDNYNPQRPQHYGIHLFTPVFELRDHSRDQRSHQNNTGETLNGQARRLLLLLLDLEPLTEVEQRETVEREGLEALLRLADSKEAWAQFEVDFMRALEAELNQREGFEEKVFSFLLMPSFEVFKEEVLKGIEMPDTRARAIYERIKRLYLDTESFVMDRAVEEGIRALLDKNQQDPKAMETAISGAFRPVYDVITQAHFSSRPIDVYLLNNAADMGQLEPIADEIGNDDRGIFNGRITIVTDDQNGHQQFRRAAQHFLKERSRQKPVNIRFFNAVNGDGITYIQTGYQSMIRRGVPAAVLTPVQIAGKINQALRNSDQIPVAALRDAIDHATARLITALARAEDPMEAERLSQELTDKLARLGLEIRKGTLGNWIVSWNVGRLIAEVQQQVTARTEVRQAA